MANPGVIPGKAQKLQARSGAMAMLKLGIALAALHLAEAFAPAPTPLAARRLPCTRPAAAPLVAMSESGGKGSSFSLPFFGGKEAQVGEKEQAKEDDDKMVGCHCQSKLPLPSGQPS